MSLAALDKGTFEQFARHFEALFNDGDAAGMAACYAIDARLLAEGSDLVQGRAAIEVFWQLDDDGRWRIAVDSSSPNPPAAS